MIHNMKLLFKFFSIKLFLKRHTINFISWVRGCTLDMEIQLTFFLNNKNLFDSFEEDIRSILVLTILSI